MSNSTSAANGRQRRKAERFCRIEKTQHVGVFKLTIRVGRQTSTYEVREIDSLLSPGGFEVVTAEGTVYQTLVDGASSTCDCKGFGRWGHCRHVESLTALRKAGRL